MKTSPGRTRLAGARVWMVVVLLAACQPPGEQRASYVVWVSNSAAAPVLVFTTITEDGDVVDNGYLVLPGAPEARAFGSSFSASQPTGSESAFVVVTDEDCSVISRLLVHAGVWHLDIGPDAIAKISSIPPPTFRPDGGPFLQAIDRRCTADDLETRAIGAELFPEVLT